MWSVLTVGVIVRGSNSPAIGFPFASTICAPATVDAVPGTPELPDNPVEPYCAVKVAIGKSAFLVAFTSMLEFFRL